MWAAIVTVAALVIGSGAGRAESAAKPYALHGTEERSFRSKIVGTDYRVLVSLPRDYARTTRKYPLLLVTDADYCFPLVHRMAWFLEDHSELVPLVIVGLDYPGVSAERYGPVLKHSRTRDYTPTFVKDGGYGREANRDSGGADRFLDFIRDELLPYLAANYRIDTADVGHVGYSYGGLLGAYALITRPGMFRRSILVSPSLWYDDHMVMKLLPKKLPRLDDLPARVYGAIGSQENAPPNKRMVTDLKKFLALLRRRRPRGFSSELWVGDGDSHHSVFPGAAIRGMSWLYRPGR